MSNCPLCTLGKKSRIDYEGPKWRIHWCITCNQPMAVYHQHRQTVDFNDLLEILEIIKNLYGANVQLRFQMGNPKCKDHFHFHIILSEELL